MRTALIALVALIAAASALRVERPEYHEDWVAKLKAHPKTPVSFVVRLHQRNVEELAKFALEVSTPGNPKYGQFMTAEEVNEFTMPEAEKTRAVAAFFEQNIINSTVDVNIAQGIVSVKAKASEVERVMETKFEYLLNRETKQKALRARSFTIPEEIESEIAAVFGLHGLPLPPKDTITVGATPDVTPDVITKKYGVTGKASGSVSVRQAVAEFQGQLMEDKDLATFFEKYLPDSPADDGKVYKYNGPHPEGEGIEAQLDIQYIMGVAPGLKTEFWEQVNSDFCADLQNWTSIMLGNQDIPLVHSVSYGWQGNLTQIGCTDSEVTAVDADFSKLAARGITIIFASGDSGSGYTPPAPPPAPRCDQTKPGTKDIEYSGVPLQTIRVESAYICCEIAHEIGERETYEGWTYTQASSSGESTCIIYKTVSGKKQNKKSTSGKPVPAPPPGPATKAKLWASWPASSPWVTAVGATRFYQDVVTNQEAAVSEEDHFGSGGGFSFQFPQATWQADAVKHYLDTVPASTLPDESKYDWPKTGRATPDVAALGTGFQVINGGQPMPVGGTSASAPTFAGIVSMLNDARVAAGKKGLGFLNPFLYKNADAFTDVTIGSDKIGRGGFPLAAGFNCSAGWDPVTGLGTPIYSKLLAAAMAEP